MCSSEVVADSEATGVRERGEREEREGTEVINYPEKLTLSELLKQQQKNKRGERV